MATTRDAVNLRPPKALPGTYVLVLSSRASARRRIGRLGDLVVEPGGYVYIGSALGPGGVQARVAHHLRRCQRPHWHIDYLRTSATVVRVHFCLDANNREHTWASHIAKMRGAFVPLRRFGATDCDCPSHLFYFRTAPTIRRLTKALRGAGGNIRCYQPAAQATL